MKLLTSLVLFSVICISLSQNTTEATPTPPKPKTPAPPPPTKPVTPPSKPATPPSKPAPKAPATPPPPPTPTGKAPAAKPTPSAPGATPSKPPATPPPTSPGTPKKSTGKDVAATVLILVGVGMGAAFALFQTVAVRAVKIDPEEADENTRLTVEEGPLNTVREVQQRLYEITQAISDGATAFLLMEYRYMAVFIAVFSIIIVLLLGLSTPTVTNPPPGQEKLTHGEIWADAIFSMLAFIIGSCTSIGSGWIGMRIAVYTNGRTALKAAQGYSPGFITAFRGGIVMGFGLSSIALINLFIGICLFKLYYHSDSNDSITKQRQTVSRLYGSIAAYGLGGSSIALFGRVGGGIFTKAADVGADLVGKVEQNIPEDDARNPGVIADCIGDNVGDIAGMGSDLFGSFGEATCAALVVASTCDDLSGNWYSMMYPLLISAVGIICCVLTSFIATNIKPATCKEDIEPVLKTQLAVSCVICTVALLGLSFLCLPSSFSMVFMNGHAYTVKNWGCWLCVCCGLWSGLGIGFITEYYTSNRYSPVIELANSCVTGAATNVIYGLALGYKSVIIPIIALSLTIYISYGLAGVFGIALGALGILSTMAICLTVDAYGPISDNAGGIAEMSGMGEDVRERTDALDAAGNTTAAIGKGYAIGSAALVGLALYGAFLTRSFQDGDQTVAVQVNIIDPRTYFGLLIGGMLPYWFSAMTMKSVGNAAMKMVAEIQEQFRTIEGLMEGRAKPNYRNCVKIATDASLKEMLPPGALVILSPVVFGIVFGRQALAGLLPGSVVSGIAMAISASNTGGAWDNAKKYVEAGNLGGKGTEIHKAAVIGDTVGDPLKDTSGPALNILVKLMAIISVVFAPVTTEKSPLQGVLFNKALKSVWWCRDGDGVDPSDPGYCQQ